VLELPVGTDFVFTFWIGMRFLTQVHILDLCASRKSVETLIVFRDGKWKKPEYVIRRLEAIEGKWWLSDTISTAMHGSGEKKTAWVLCRE
jgi:hypothetical protein